jgi:uncharacterized iron-regulated membrane protein
MVDFTHMVLDARTGRDLGRLPDRRAGRSIKSRIMPFIKDLHYNLALGEPGTWVFFIVALAWTVDCLASVVLTLPVTAVRFWSRWKHAWLVRLGAGSYRVNFDLHRAGGLWFLVALFVFAWSSVQLEDKAGTYDQVMARIFDYRMPQEAYEKWPRHDATPLRLDWFAAQRRGEELMNAQAHQLGFRILAPASLVNFPDNGLYNYEVTTDRSFPDPVRETVFFDGDTGAIKVLPGFERHVGNVVSDWFRALHMATDPVDYTPYRWFVCLFGIVLSTISVTGVVIWWKKHRARAFSR